MEDPSVQRMTTPISKDVLLRLILEAGVLAIILEEGVLATIPEVVDLAIILEAMVIPATILAGEGVS